jgi:hypothetical protein
MYLPFNKFHSSVSSQYDSYEHRYDFVSSEAFTAYKCIITRVNTDDAERVFETSALNSNLTQMIAREDFNALLCLLEHLCDNAVFIIGLPVLS